MATQVFKVEKFVLQDENGEAGKEVTITPLPIKHLRKFMDTFQKMSEVESELEITDLMFECATIAVQARNPDITAEELEDSLDLQTAIKILELAGGVNLDPNQ